MSIIDYPNGSTNANPLVLTDDSTDLQVTSGSAIQSGVISESGGSFGLEKVGAGTLVLTANETYTGTTTISGGTLQVGNGGASGFIGGDIINNGVLVHNTSSFTQLGGISGTGSLIKNGTGTLVLYSGNSFTGGTVVNSGSIWADGLSALPGNITNNASIKFALNSDFLGGNTPTYSGVISGTGSVEFNGMGKLILASPQTYTGGTTLAFLTLQLGAGGSLASTGAVDLHGTLDLNGYNQTIGALSGAGSITLGSATLTTNSDTDTTSTAHITGSGGLTKGGTGTLTLSNFNGYTGVTTISGGAIALGTNGSDFGSLAGNVIDNAQLIFNRPDSYTFAGVISGTGQVSQTGAGKTTLTAVNSYSGGTTISAGTLAISDNAALGNNSGAISIGAGTLRFNSSVTLARPVQLVAPANQTATIDGTIYGSFVTGNITGSGNLFVTGNNSNLALTGANSYSGTTTVDTLAVLNIGNGTTSGTLGSGNVIDNGVIVFNRADATIVSNAISGTGRVTVFSGDITYTGSNSYQGLTNIRNGTTLRVGDGGTTGTLGIGNVGGDNVTLIFNRADGLTYAGTLQDLGAGQLSVTQAGSGTLILTGANTYTGGTTINSGSTLQIGNGGTSGSLPDLTVSAFWVANNGTLIFDRSDTSVFHNIVNGNGAIIKQGAGTLIVNGNLNGSSITISQGILQIGSGPEDGAFNANVINNATLAFGYNANFISHINNVISGSGGVSLSGGGDVIYKAAQTYTGGTTIGAGALQLGTGGSLSSAGALTVNGGAFDLNGHTQTVGALSGAGGTIALGSGSLTTDSNTNTNLAAVISGSGFLTKNGTGTLTLTAANTYTGGTIINGGTLRLAANAHLAASAFMVINGGTFDVNGNSQLIDYLSGNGGSITLGVGNLAINQTLEGTFAGTITGAGGVTLNTGRLFLTGDSSYSGGTTIVAGALFVGANSTTGSIAGNVSIGSAGYLMFQRSNTATFNGAISGSGQVVHNGTGTLILGGNSTFTGGTTLNRSGNTLRLENSNAAGTGAININVTGTIDYANGIVVANPISGIGVGLQASGGVTATQSGQVSSGIQKLGAGTLVITGSVSGAATVSAGTLQIGKGGTSGSIGGAINNNANLTFNRSDVITVGSVISGTGSVTQTGSGVLLLTANNTYTGGTIIASNGALRLGNNGTTGSIVGNVVDDGLLSFERSNTITYGGVVSGAGRVTQAGSGTTILGANNSYTGVTTITSGILLVNGAIASSAVTVANGTLGGSGTVGTTIVQGGGKLAPGDGIGTLQVNGNLTLASGAIFAEEFLPGAADEVVVSGNASIAGNLTANFSGSGYNSQTYTILHSTGTLSGTFASISVTGLPAGMSAALTYGVHGVTLTVNNAPVTATANITASQGQSFALSSLFSVTDADGDAITRYQLWQSTRDPNSGHFVVNGVAQAPATLIDITAAQLAQTSFVAGSVGDTLQIRAFDGYGWSAADNASWSPFTVSPRINHAPTVTTGPVSAQRNQSLALSSLVTVSDPDGDSITKYQLWDSNRDALSGHFVINNVAQPAGQIIEVDASQLAQTSFLTGSVNDILQIRASDGAAWSAGDNAVWAPFTVNVPASHAPVVTTGPVNASRNQSLALSNLFSVNDADGDSMTRYQLWDSTPDPASGHFVVNGVDKPAGQVIDITASQLAQTSFLTGSANDVLQIRAFDGAAWSAGDNAVWAPFTVSVPANRAPVVTTGTVNAQANQSLALSNLFSVSDPDGDSMTRYQLWDSTRDPASGHFVVNGVDKPAGQVIDITASQLAQTSFLTGSVNDTLEIRAFDGAAWSAGDNAVWAPFTVSVPVNHAPIVTTGPVSAQRGQTLALSSLFSVSDADGNSMTKYQLWDSTRDPASGHFVIGGADQAAGQVIEVTAAQLAQTSFLTGSVNDTLEIRAFDGAAWSAGDNTVWAPFTVSVPVNHAPVVTTSPVSAQQNQPLTLSSLFSVSDADGDSMTRYQLWDSTQNPASGHFVVNGADKPAGQVIDITAAQLAQTSFLTGSVNDVLQIRAFDGFAWSAADNANWAPFLVSVA